MTTIYNQLSKERKEYQAVGLLPEWFTTGGWQLFKEKYLYGDEEGINDSYRRIAKCAAKHMLRPTGSRKVDEQYLTKIWEERFYTLMWNGWLALSTPVLANMGTDRGMPVSCSGQHIGDSINGFYSAYKELAVLTKNGFGTSSYLGDIRPRGSAIGSGGTASGVLDVITSCVEVMRKVAQGTSRRGAWAGYLPISHGDFFEVVDYLEHHPDDLNLGWVITDEDIGLLEQGDPDMTHRMQRMMKVKCVTGKGYLFFVDKANRQNPECYKRQGIEVSASNLCIEICLPQDDKYTFTCVLSSMNLAKYNEWKDTQAVEHAIMFLDCVASEFIERAKHDETFEKAVRFTQESRALGLGTLGFHTYLQQESVPFDSFRAYEINFDIFWNIHTCAKRASEQMAKWFGVPKLCRGSERRNSHLLAIAPNTSSALICGGVSQGIEPVVANIYNQPTAAGELYRVNPVFLELAKKQGRFDEALVTDLLDTEGSVQHLDWLTDHEKEVFKTAYEVNQMSILNLASARQMFICQSQSLNFFMSTEATEADIMKVMKAAILDKRVKGVYYLRTLAGVQASKEECKACEG